LYPPQYSNQATAFQSPTSKSASISLSDPYFGARYQQPLGLPQDFSPRQGAPVAEAAKIRQQLALQEEQEAERQAQEEADAALARQLDLKLNFGDI